MNPLIVVGLVGLFATACSKVEEWVNPNGANSGKPEEGPPPPKEPQKIPSTNMVSWKANYGYYHIDQDGRRPGIQTRVGTEETAIKEFESLPLDDRARLFRELVEAGKRGGRTVEFLQNLTKYSPKEASTKKIRESLNHINKLSLQRYDPKLLWERRFEMDYFLFNLEQDYQHYSSQENSDPNNLLMLRSEIGSVLVRAYSASAVHGKSPLFDTDGDGLYDYSLERGLGQILWHDDFPLEATLQTDVDRDDAPDIFDTDFWDPEKEVSYLPGETYPVGKWKYEDQDQNPDYGYGQVKSITHSTIDYSVQFGKKEKEEQDQPVKVTLPVYLMYDEKIKAALEEKKPLWKRQAEEYFNKQFSENILGWDVTLEIKFLEKPSDQHQLVSVHGDEAKANEAPQWAINMDETTLYRAVARLLGRPDRSHNLHYSPHDRTFKPGFHFLVDSKDLMGSCRKNCQFGFTDILAVVDPALPYSKLRQAGLEAWKNDQLEKAEYYFEKSLVLEKDSIGALYLRRIHEIQKLRSEKGNQ